MKRNKQIPTAWIVGLGVGALVLLYVRTKKDKDGRQDACFSQAYNAQMASLTSSGVPQGIAHAQATAVAKAACRSA